MRIILSNEHRVRNRVVTLQREIKNEELYNTSNMRYIGFKNFRKFENFPNLELSPITMLVGGNNAGKSSVVKGILALSDFFSYRNDMFEVDMFMREKSESDIKKMKLEALKGIKFFFNTSYLAHIGTFKRALYNRAKDNVITFKTDIGPCDFEIEIIGNRNDDELVFGTVSKVRLFINDYFISVEFDLRQDLANVVFHHNCVERITDNNRRRDIDSFKKYFSSFDKDYYVTATISENWMPSRSDIIGSLMESIEAGIEAALFPISEKGENRGRFYKASPIKIDEETLSFLKMYCDSFLSSYMGPRRYSVGNGFRLPYARMPIYRMTNIEYLYAHAVTQTVIYSAKDSNDYLSKTIHEFAPLQSHKNKREFIIKWMKEFGIGQNFVIKSVGGEAHLVWIVNNDGEKVNLADKGMGSIQLMVLLFRLAITLPQNRRERMMSPERMGIIIIEEPEQNLHPRLQSKLADLFYELNRNYGYRFLIETHSEYIIRRSQVIVANENYADESDLKKHNPFMVYYFDEKNEREPYYPMEYELSGAFKDQFGEGFFDEASKWDMTIIRKEFELKKKNKK